MYKRAALAPVSAVDLERKGYDRAQMEDLLGRFGRGEDISAEERQILQELGVKNL
jgi:hypothetical protein